MLGRTHRPQRCPYGASHHVASWHKLWGRSPSRKPENLSHNEQGSCYMTCVLMSA